MSATWFDLTGKVAVVTGGSKGLGRTIAGALARAGADVAITSRTQADLDQVAAELREHGHQVLSVRSDVTDEDSIRTMVQQVIDRFGQIDILVNNAGVEGVGAVTEMTRRVLGPRAARQPARPDAVLQARGTAHDPQAARQGDQCRLGTGVAGGALHGRVRRQQGGPRATHADAGAGMDPAQRAGERPVPGVLPHADERGVLRHEAGRTLITKLPIGRLGEVHEIEGAAVFLASDATSYITGTTLYVDGGHSLA